MQATCMRRIQAILCQGTQGNDTLFGNASEVPSQRNLLSRVAL